jgi:hypothetical protein
MKQLRQLVNIHLRSGKDANVTVKNKVTLRDSNASFHEAFHELRSQESRLKANLNQLLCIYLKIKNWSSKVVRGNNTSFPIQKEFESDFSTIWEFEILNSLGHVLIKQVVEPHKLKWIGKEIDQEFKKTTVIFEFNDGFYLLEKEREINFPSPMSIKISYSLKQFKSIKSREDSLNKLQDQISEILENGKIILSRGTKKKVKTQIREIEALIIESSHQILGIKGKIYQIKNVLKDKLEKIQKSRAEGMNYAKNLLEKRAKIQELKTLLGQKQVELGRAQVNLALQSRGVFQIIESKNSINGLENDDTDEKSSSFYGLLSLLVSVLFGILNLSPRYPLLLKGSRCCIIDYISLKSFFPL